MSLERCPTGHFYDPAKHDSCPYCGVAELGFGRDKPRKRSHERGPRRADLQTSPSQEPLRVFISSTFADLQDHRQAVFDAIMNLGYSSENMIYWSADEREPLEVSLNRVRGCDVFILLTAHRYGSVPEGSSHSITEQEYNAARSSNIPVLAFLVDENLPWPPQFIEWETRDQLAAFKKKVKSEVTVKTFTSPDNLSALLSQALSSFKTRHSSTSFRGGFRWAMRVDPTIKLEVTPDLTIQAGYAEDELPLLLQVRRSSDLTPVLDELATMTTRPGFVPPQALLSAFRQSVEQHALRAWASDGIQRVKMQSGAVQPLFVVNTPLSRLFSSSFGSLLLGVPYRPSPATTPRTAAALAPSPTYLQSEGGSNRFLGIACKDGSVFSVGRARDAFGMELEGWQEWRPFFFESLPRHFPEATFDVSHEGSTPVRVPGKHYREALLDAALASSKESSYRLASLEVSVSLEVPKNSLATLIVQISRAVADLHANGIIHGDLKPANVLLSSEGIELIDDFQLRAGEIAPGWTPEWSAPEQALGEPLSIAADVYPFGRLIAELLGGKLIGEVRKFKSTFRGEHLEFDIFYNPSVRVPPNGPIATRDGVAAWTDLARRCLCFEPDKRLASPEIFAEELSHLIATFPLAGNSRFYMKDNLVAARFPDGSEGLGRLIKVDSTSPESTDA